MKRMTPKQLANLRPIKKGEVRNPEGGRSVDPVVRALKKLTAHELQAVISLVAGKTLPELKALAKDPKSTVLTVWVCAIVIKGIEKGDPFALDKLMERVMGKVRQEVALGDPQGNALPPAEVHIHIPSNGREKV